MPKDYSLVSGRYGKGKWRLDSGVRCTHSAAGLIYFLFFQEWYFCSYSIDPKRRVFHLVRKQVKAACNPALFVNRSLSQEVKTQSIGNTLLCKALRNCSPSIHV